MIYSVAGQKGGVGKTTLALGLACELFDRGRKVLVVDADPQGSASTWADVGAEQGVSAPPVVAMGSSLHSQIPSLATDYDDLIVDCPPRHDKLQRAAIIVSDVVLLPCGPSPLDAWALGASITLIEEARGFKPDLTAAIVVNRKDSRTSLGKQTRAVLQGHGLPVLRSEIGLRVVYCEALLSGSVATRANDRTAAREFAAFVDEAQNLATEGGRSAVA